MTRHQALANDQRCRCPLYYCKNQRQSPPSSQHRLIVRRNQVAECSRYNLMKIQKIQGRQIPRSGTTNAANSRGIIREIAGQQERLCDSERNLDCHVLPTRQFHFKQGMTRKSKIPSTVSHSCSNHQGDSVRLQRPIDTDPSSRPMMLFVTWACTSFHSRSVTTMS